MSHFWYTLTFVIGAFATRDYISMKVETICLFDLRPLRPIVLFPSSD